MVMKRCADLVEAVIAAAELDGGGLLLSVLFELWGFWDYDLGAVRLLLWQFFTDEDGKLT